MSAHEPRSRAPCAPAHADTRDALFLLDGAGFAVPGRDLVKPLTLALPARRVLALIGHNGSGKSTLVKLLAGQLAPTAGRILLEGRPLSEWPARAFARKVAYLPQQIPAGDGLLVRELVAMGRYPWHGALGSFGAGDRVKVDEAMALTGVEALADRLVGTLSGGERQRAWIAMLVAQDTECLLLDEPTSALDVVHQIEILTLVRRLARDRGLVVVVVLHDVNMASRFCDETVALGRGNLLIRGTAAEIMTPDALRRIYGLDMLVLPHPTAGHPIAVAA
ncbi:ATP-binding cassette domain-containing protein [Rhodoplanes sp. TEM]|uniref:ATP-binding cassette domain-containing protein n=1 Tax=Rhodoplanes tepidamans TaxID=200616 RepID=A0ABT5JET0_RHOTP|nr:MULTISPECIES: ATP-binding cassette domain-containing protein [Rhodoplanes]MDC7788114.1 ATP-binding cassette domain-containing protein [Rhodoplanes tepidamans]MDC7984596.1 ATP-binding cassette domain-containing protein [Rhodoplanes sp. TEM]MDQ0355595.1 iron complex transport system ATP-binding protein [Rhodoplanes tepidamans]